MAEPLKNHFGPAVPQKIAMMIEAVHPTFDVEAFMADVLAGYEALELIPRGWHIAHALHAHLPASYEEAIEVLLASLGPVLERTERNGMSPFLYLPHVFYVAAYGLQHFEASMHAQYELTQRFTAEFSIRAYLEKHPEATLERLMVWTRDDSVHVRRLVSEGTRPRLPWAPRLRAFQKDPAPVLLLLEQLKDDPDLYVRRSVANNLNDIGKDHPALLVATARKWMAEASPERQWLIRHALRSAIKRGDTDALALLGYDPAVQWEVSEVQITPPYPVIGDKVTLQFTVTNPTADTQRAMVDGKVHFVKANGTTRPKVFKLKDLTLVPKETVTVTKSVSLAQLSTRTHYPGKHHVEVVVNGRAQSSGSFIVHAKTP